MFPSHIGVFKLWFPNCCLLYSSNWRIIKKSTIGREIIIIENIKNYSLEKHWIDTNADLFHRLLIISNLHITSLRIYPKTKREKTTPEIFNLLEEPLYEYVNIKYIKKPRRLSIRYARKHQMVTKSSKDSVIF